MSFVSISGNCVTIESLYEYGRLPLGGGQLSDGRRYYRVWDDLCSVYILREDIHQWLEERKMVYHLGILELNDWQVFFLDNQDAMMFKLVWG